MNRRNLLKAGVVSVSAACFPGVALGDNKKNIKTIKLVRIGSDEHPASENDVETVLNMCKKRGENKTIDDNFLSVIKKTVSPCDVQYDIIECNVNTQTIVVKVGTQNRPALCADVVDMQKEMDTTKNDMDLTIITHHCFFLTVCDNSEIQTVVTFNDDCVDENSKSSAGVEGLRLGNLTGDLL